MHLKLKQVDLLSLIECFILFPFSYLMHFQVVIAIFLILRPVLLILEMLMLFRDHLRGRKHYLKSIQVKMLLLVYVVFQWMITILKNSMGLAESIVYPIDILLLIMMSLRCDAQRRKEGLLYTANLYIMFGIIVNAIVVVLFPKGIYSVMVSSGAYHNMYFLSIDNQFGSFLLPGTAFVLYCNEKKERKKYWFSIFMLALLMLPYIITNSQAGLISSAVLVLLYLIFRVSRNRITLIVKWFVPGLVLFNVSLIMGQVFIYQNPLINSFITRIAGKEMTFSNRTYIWAEALRMLPKHLLFGYGRSSQSALIVWHSRHVSSHNAFLQVLLESGIVGFALFAIFTFRVFWNSKAVLKSHPETMILYLGLFSTLLYYSMEVGSMQLMFFVMLILCDTALKKTKGVGSATPHRKSRRRIRALPNLCLK